MKAIIDMPWAAWALGETRPMTMKTTVNTRPKSRHRPSAARPSATVPPRRKPKRNPKAAVERMAQVLVGSRPGPDRGRSTTGGGQGEQAVGEPLDPVLGHGHGDATAGEEDDGGHIARDQEVDVAGRRRGWRRRRRTGS